MRTEMERNLGEILDEDWVRSQFYAPLTSSEEEAHRISTLRYQTTANTSIGGSGLGNSRVLNPPPGINRFADTPRGFDAGGTGEGNGVYHHEFLEKPMDIVHFRPGVPRFNPLAEFWTGAFNPDALESGDYGWIRKTANFLGKLLGFFVSVPLKVGGALWKTLKSLVLGPNANRYSFYYLSPAPFSFWKGLDDMVNVFAIKLGLTGDARYSDTQLTSGKAIPNEVRSDLTEIMSVLPGVFSETSLAGGYRIDSITLAHRYNMMNNMRTDFLKKKSIELLGQEFSTPKEYYNAIAKWEEALLTNPTAYSSGDTVQKKLNAARDTLRALNTMQSSEERYKEVMGSFTWKGEAQSRDKRESSINSTINADESVSSELDPHAQDLVDVKAPGIGAEFSREDKKTDFQELLASVTEGGLDFFSLAVDHVESGSISINNSVGPSNIESMFNGMVSASKSTWFSASNGNISEGLIGGTIQSAIQTGASFVNGVMSEISGGVQSAVFGGKAYIDVPDAYQNSTTTMPTMSYTFTSQAISGHPISKLKMLFPILALLRIGAPISGGPRSFMSPYLVAVTHKGRAVCNMGLITNVSIDWGGEAGWDINDIPCEIKCKFEVADLDKNYHVPLTSDLTDTFNDDGTYEAFANVLAGVSPTDLDRSWSYNMKCTWAKAVSKVDRFFSASHTAMALGLGTRSVFEGPISAMGGYVEWRE